MSRIKLLLDVVENMRSLADSIQSVAEQMTEGEPAQPVAQEYLAAAPKCMTTTVSLEDVRAVLAEKSQAGYTSEVRGLLEKHGASKLSQIDPANFAAAGGCGGTQMSNQKVNYAAGIREAGPGHAILSASGAHRWMSCTPSARLECGFADNSGDAAAEGTAAHALAEHKLRKALKLHSKKPVSKYDSEEMEECTDGYVEFVLENIACLKQNCSDPKVLIEQRLDFSRFVPEGFGTGDCVVIADGVLHIIDFKYGQGVLVGAEDNPQMKLYALGALDLFDGIYDISEVHMTIYQPRRENVSTYTVLKESLYQWAEEVLMPKAKLAFEGSGEYCSGEWCRFCRAAVKCRVRAEENISLARLEFAMPPLLADEDIENILAKLEELTSWANQIRAYALEAALSHGKRWSGFKLVEGRSNRKYKNDEAVAKAAEAAGYRDIYKQSLITLTEIEKLMGKSEFNEILGELIEKPPGKPALVSITDKRPEINTSAKQDFKEEN